MVWIPQLGQFLIPNDITLELETTYAPTYQRIGDNCIMDWAISQSYSAREIQIINACRLYLKVILISDIATIEGTHIHINIICGYPIPGRTLKAIFPYQAKPNASSWRLWRHFLYTFSDPTTNQLRQNLGAWFPNAHHKHCSWDGYANFAHQRLYICKHQRFKEYQATLQGILSDSHVYHESLPHNTIP